MADKKRKEETNNETNKQINKQVAGFGDMKLMEDHNTSRSFRNLRRKQFKDISLKVAVNKSRQGFGVDLHANGPIE